MQWSVSVVSGQATSAGSVVLALFATDSEVSPMPEQIQPRPNALEARGLAKALAAVPQDVHQAFDHTHAALKQTWVPQF